MLLERLCLFCVQFTFDMGLPGYSEWTPGTDVCIQCDAGHWQMDDGDSETTYRMNLLRGLTCLDFQLAKMPWLDAEMRKLLERE